MATIFHLAFRSDWEAATAGGTYTVSTRGRSLAEVGYIHASRGDQWPAVRDRFYADVEDDLVLLRIDTDLLGVPVLDEPAGPGSTETFPHIYGPLPVTAVTAVIGLESPAPPSPPTRTSARTTAPAPTGAAPAAGPAQQPSFSALYFREMFRNAALILLVLAFGFAGILLGIAVGGDLAPGAAGVLGTAAGVAVAVRIYRRDP